MIPHRMLSYEISGNGLRERVTACRKRLRENRVRNHVLTETDEICGGNSPLQSFGQSQIRFDGGDFSGELLYAEEQEVGIT